MMQVHFTLGPVQGFVAQARRTRDLWAGSFLLSYLSGQAMRHVLAEGGAIHFPHVHEPDRTITDPLLRAIDTVHREDRCSGGPAVGSLPNRFVAWLPEGADPAGLGQAVLTAWQKVTDTVWKQYVQPAAHLGRNTEAIWRRQSEGFWDMAWAVGEEPSLLDQRKNWRTHVPTTEPGDKCTLMGNLQELSGHIRTSRTGRDQQEEFWRRLCRPLGDLELGEDERLCTISLVKRLFPLVAEEAIRWRVASGYPSYPSTVYLAAVPWLAQQCRDRPAAAAAYGDLAARLLPSAHREPSGRFPVLKTATTDHPAARSLIRLDGNCLFPEALVNPRLWPPGTEAARDELRVALERLTAGLGPPSPYYAVLLMDGDNMGALLRERSPQQISAGLAAFTERVGPLVEGENGVLVYAGGDDVLALFPLPYALGAAARLRAAYCQALAEHIGGVAAAPTISAAIVYAQYHAPLQHVLRWAHELLDHDAKDDTGRDSLAVGLWQSGGPTLRWAAPWPVLVRDQADGSTLLHQLARSFAGSGDGGRGYSASFFYKIREQFELLTDRESGDVLPDLDAVQVLAAEYRRSREPGVDELPAAEVRARIERLLEVARRYHRPDPRQPHRPVGTFHAAGPLLVKFLAQKGATE